MSGDTPAKWPFHVVVGGERQATVEKVFGTNRLPIKSPITERSELVGLPGTRLVYQLAFEQLSAEQQAKLCAFMAEKHGCSPEEARAGILAEGFAVMAHDTVVEIDDPQRWLS